ncbi:AbfB domain-containing protein [Streptomyces syringium]|uniref:AbfB domain-containing protein n=1 Tax=Streptomyces syringium TaxID=76729 RepID=UPI003453F8E4
MNASRTRRTHLREAIRRGLVTATVLTAVLGVYTPGTAAADVAKESIAADSIGTTETQRVAAASVVRLDPTPDVLLLSDYDFIHALWQKARDGGEQLDSVRTAAEAAMASSPEEQVLFVTTGIHQAYELDKQREKDRADADRAARQARLQDLLAVGIPSTPELLALSDENFILAFAEHANSGPEVRAAARLALAGDQTARREFIVNGAREAHQRDVANKLKELEEKDRAEAERRKELAARKNVADLFGIAASEAMLNLSDDNFIRELLRKAPSDLKDSEMVVAAQRAILSPAAKDWKEFIHTGAEEAYKRDDMARRKRLADANRRVALQIQAANEKSLVNPGLAAAAKKALSGTDEDVANFLRPENQYRARRQSVKYAYRMFLRESRPDGRLAYAVHMYQDSKYEDRLDATWVVVPALVNQTGCFSFESPRNPGYYLMAQKNNQVRLTPSDGSEEFKKRATWCVTKKKSDDLAKIVSAMQPTNELTENRQAVIVSEDADELHGWLFSPPLAP